MVCKVKVAVSRIRVWLSGHELLQRVTSPILFGGMSSAL